MTKKKPYVLKRDTNISEILKNCPKAAEMLIEYGLFCIGCYLNQFETLEAGARVHNMSDKQIQKMIKEINNELKKEYE
jgi:hybrid cluster-associated redox disulfide protein